MNTVVEDVELMLDLAEVTPDDHLIDLGAGDGRIVIAAARRGARGLGVELDPELVALARTRAREAGVEDRVDFVVGDIFEAHITQASVVTLYLFPEANLRLRPKLLSELRPGTRVVSNAFHMGDWKPDGRAQGRTSGGAMLWVVPVDAAGHWRAPTETGTFSIAVTQRFQEIDVRAHREGAPLRIEEAHLSGDTLTLSMTDGRVSHRFRGTIEGDAMRGTRTTIQDGVSRARTFTARRDAPREGTGDIAPSSRGFDGDARACARTDAARSVPSAVAEQMPEAHAGRQRTR